MYAYHFSLCFIRFSKLKGFSLLIHMSLLYSFMVIIGLKSQYLWTFLLADTAEVIQSRLNEQEGREEFYVHYVGCEYLTHYRCACDPNSPLHLYPIVQ